MQDELRTIHSNLRATARTGCKASTLAVAPDSMAQRSLRDALEALDCRPHGPALDDARIAAILTQGESAQAVRSLGVLAEYGILNLQRTIRVPGSAAKQGLADLLASHGQEPPPGPGTASLADRFALLRAHGVNLEASTGKRRLTPLHQAAMNGNDAAIGALGHLGVALNAGDAGGMTPLMHAVLKGEAAAVRALVERGANPDLESPDGRIRAVHYAAHADRGDVLRAMALNPVQLAAPVANGMTALHLAANRGACDAIRALVALGVPVDLHTGRSQKGPNATHPTPLAVAAMTGQVAAIHTLVELGASLEEDNSGEGHTALHVAASKNQPDSIKALAACGAQLNARDDEGMTALHIAAHKDLPQVVEALALAGADLNVTDRFDNRPIDVAGRRSNPYAFSALVKAGAARPHRYTPSGT